MTWNENRLPGSESTTVPFVFHVLFPERFVPRNFAPGCGPVAPPRHSAPSFSGDHSPIRVTSDTIAHTCSADAAMSRVTLTSSAIRGTVVPSRGACAFDAPRRDAQSYDCFVL